MRFALFVSLLVVQAFAFSSSQPTTCPKTNCLAVVDSGSSGTRLLVYAYDINNITGLPDKIDTIGNHKITPGLTSIPANESRVAEYLTALINDMNIDNIPVYYYSTAGMRLESPNKQHRYYQFISDWFKQQPNLVLKEIKTISGKDEGKYGWLAINYQLGTLNKPAQEQKGVLDMGGASVQIVFPVDDPQKANSHIYVNGKLIHLYVDSYLGMGQTEVGHQFLDYSYCYSNNYPLPSGRKGRGDWDKCLQRVDNLTNGVHNVSRIKQYLDYAPTNLAWIAMGSMMYVKHDKPFDFQDKTVTLEMFHKLAQQRICQQDWQELNNEYQDSDNLNFFCLYPAYYYSLIVDGFGFSPSQEIQEVPNNITAGWTMGVVVNSLVSSKQAW